LPGSEPLRAADNGCVLDNVRRIAAAGSASTLSVLAAAAAALKAC